MWREAATVILASLRAKKGSLPFNYDLLSIKRSAKSSFMPGMYVFPGGTAHAADSSNKWIDLFSKYNVELKLEIDKAAAPPILLSNGGDIPNLLSLKITAIRETFEETGILLCKTGTKSNEWASNYIVDNANSWRLRIEKDAFEFINFCENFNCYPDVNNLYLWSNWLTPKSKSKRFDTLFFIVLLSETPASLADKHEIDNTVWLMPSELLEKNNKGEIVLPPPQIYEISRLMYFNKAKDLLTFSKERAGKGCERWMPQYIKAADGTVSLLPGDDAYNPDGYDGLNIPIPVLNMTMEEFRSQSSALHRFQGNKIFVKNYSPKNGHVLPLV